MQNETAERELLPGVGISLVECVGEGVAVPGVSTNAAAVGRSTERRTKG